MFPNTYGVHSGFSTYFSAFSMTINSTWLNFDPDTNNFQILARRRQRTEFRRQKTENCKEKMSSRDSNGTMASNDPGEAIKVYVRVRKLLEREKVNKVEWKVDNERSISSDNGAKK